MPIYEYQCRSCGERTEVMQRVSDPRLETCDDCGGELRKLISAPAFQFKGSGWYVTDYARKGGGEKTESKETSKDGSGGDGKSADASASKGDSSGGSGSGTPAKGAAGQTKAERLGSTDT